MSKRKPALSTQLRQAQADLASLATKLKTVETSVKYNSDRATKAEQEIEQVHSFLDAVPNPPDRKTTGDYAQPVALMTRLAVYVSTRAGA